MNFPTALLAAAVAVVFISIVVSGVRRRKRGGGCSGGCGCSGCAGTCHLENERRAAGKGSCGGIDEWAGTVSSGRLPPGAGCARRALRRYRADAGCNASLGCKDAFLLSQRCLIARERYGKVYLTDTGCLLARCYARRLEKVERMLAAELALTREEAQLAACALLDVLPERCFTQGEVPSA